jgi:hypothetical protein
MLTNDHHHNAPLWDEVPKNPILSAIAEFASQFDLDYEVVQRSPKPDDDWYFHWSGETPGTWIRVFFPPLKPQSPKLLLINAILNDSRMALAVEFELEELDDVDQLQTALEELSLWIGFG